PSTTYQYQVRARDAAGNVSDPSNTAEATTPAAPTSGTFTFAAAADSYVDASQPSRNYGTSSVLRADASPVLTSYLKFDVQAGVPAIRAMLRVYASASHSSGFSVRSVADNSWVETTITATNAPAVGAVVATSGPLTAGTWVEIDVTSLITGTGEVTVALTTSSGTSLKLDSRQGANAPQLIIESN
ncbi:MAG: DNRLRE domain-containing protein, partial [Candidatus Limnocylindria bacterium]